MNIFSLRQEEGHEPSAEERMLCAQALVIGADAERRFSALRQSEGEARIEFAGGKVGRFILPAPEGFVWVELGDWVFTVDTSGAVVTISCYGESPPAPEVVAGYYHTIQFGDCLTHGESIEGGH